jgi:hypothetical protein
MGEEAKEKDCYTTTPGQKKFRREWGIVETVLGDDDSDTMGPS